MKVAHFHFGKDGGAERFFVQLVNALYERDVEQISVIRPNRAWRGDIENATQLIESNYRYFSHTNFTLPRKVMKLANNWEPNALFAWMPRAARLIPEYKKCIRLARLGDYPPDLQHFDRIDTLVCNTPGIAEHVRDLGWTRGVEMISNFTTATPAQPIDRAMLDTPEDAFVVSASGRFVHRKGFDTVIDAMVEAPDMYFWLIGDGKEADNLKAQARKLGVMDRIRFAGWQENATAYVRASNAYVAASRLEPLGNIVLEAWAQEVPVVSTKSQGPSWFMEHGENGLMVEINDAEGIAKALKRFQSDPKLAKKMVAGGSKTLAEKFSKKVITDAYIELFKQKP